MSTAENIERHTLPFLAALTDDWPTKVRMQWQTFDDRPEKSNRPWTKYASHSEASSDLHAANVKGSGIFVTVNETDGQGRRLENVVHIRAFWADFDGVDPALDDLPLQPSIVVQSRAGKHLYWLSRGDVAFDEHRRIQERIALALGSDPNVKDASRVLRVPGYYHHKGSPFLVSLVEANGDLRYTFAQMKVAF